MSRYDDPDGADGRSGRPRRPGRSRGGSTRRRASLTRRIIGGTAITLVCTLVAGALYVYEKYGVAWDDINRVDVSKDLTLAHRPPQYGNALNLLMIGSDTRTGENGKIGGADQGARSDTVMVVHLSPGRHSVVVMSFPRDSVVPVLACAPEAGTPGQTAEPGQIEQLNTTFANGGPGCLWQTIEQTTHIRIDDFLELTFVGFEKVIDGIGGVNVCLPYAVDDSMSGLHLPAGRHHIYGSQALAFWRTREDLGIGSDLQRIERDQLLMVALLHGIEKNDLLKSKTRMLNVLTSTAKAGAITMDSGMTTGRVLEIAESLSGLAPKAVQFIEIPTVTYPQNVNWVQWAPQDTGLFASIAHNSKLPKAKKATKGTAPVLETVSPSAVQVEVLNGTGQDGLASTTGTSLSGLGFDVLGESDAPNADYTNSIVEYATKAGLPAARTLAATISGATLQRVRSVPHGTVDLILGSSFSGVTAKKPPAQNVGDLSKNFGGITGNTNICNNSTAFAS